MAADDIIRVALIDDHTVIREAIAWFLQSRDGLDVVGQASSIDGAMELVRETHPHIVLVDLGLDPDDGLDPIRRLQAEAPDIRCIAFTAREQGDALREVLTAGGAGYVSKSRSPQELLSAIEQAHRGRTPILATFDADFATPDEAPHLQLSPRELEVLQAIAEGHTSKEVAQQLAISPTTIDTYRRRVGEKLGLKSRAEMVKYCLRHGLLSG